MRLQIAHEGGVDLRPVAEAAPVASRSGSRWRRELPEAAAL